MASWRSMTKIEGSGSGSISQRHESADPDPDPPQNVMDPQHWFFCILLLFVSFWRYFYIIFQKWKVKKKSQNSRNQGFSYYFCLMIEGSGSRAGSESIPLTYGSGGPKTRGSWSGSATLVSICLFRCRNWKLVIFSSSKQSMYVIPSNAYSSTSFFGCFSLKYKMLLFCYWH